MKFGSKQGHRRVLFAAVFAVATAFVFGLLVRQSALKLFSLSSHRLNVQEIHSDQDIQDTESSVVNDILTDSILSVVQSYYVDPARVDNRRLLEIALESLTDGKDITSQLQEDRFWIQIKNKRWEFKFNTPLSYEELLGAFKELSKIVENSEVAIGAVDYREKDKNGAITLLNSMLSYLDAHSALLSSESYRELRQGTEGSFGGLGVLVGIRDSLLTVIKPLPNSPAIEAGINRYDRILGIDDIHTYGYSLDELVEYMRGAPGTKVKLRLLRETAMSPKVYDLQREIIRVDSVVEKRVTSTKDKVLHLVIENFSSRTSREVLDAVKRARLRGKGVLHGLVLDLRNNPGGLLDQAVQVADLFLKSGVIVTTKGRRQEIENAANGQDELDFPIVILINGDSASASEIVAGALQDHSRALVVGQPSFGKGSVQTIFELPAERALKLTIARYYTPSGRTIQNMGIVPDIWLQPVNRVKANSNILGQFRYKNERFLSHSLASSSNGKRRSGDFRPAAIKGYHLIKKAENYDEEVFPDRELNTALAIIHKTRQTYGDHLPVSAQRASHWLALTSPEVKRMVTKRDKRAVNWLSETKTVDWSLGRKIDNPDLILKIGDATKDFTRAGENFNIHWSIKNEEPASIGRVSVFVRSEVAGFETYEVLVGKLKSGRTKSGKISIPIPTYWEAGPLSFRVGLAVDAWPAKTETRNVSLLVVPRHIATLSATAKLISETGGRVEGVLENEERAKLKINIKNSGEADSRNTTLKFLNLAGKQVDFDVKKLAIGTIKAGSGKSVLVDIAGGSRLLTKELSIGLSVESKDLQMPFRKRISIKGLPGAKRIQSKAIAH